MITVFVFMMMVIVEYLNIMLRGRMRERMRAYPTGQSLLAGFLGAAPGCLGVFTSVTLYEHGVLSFGALVAGMIATSGDEAFVMLSLFPGKYVLLTAILLMVGVLTGVVIDKLLSRRWVAFRGIGCERLVVHEATDVHVLKRPVNSLVANLGGPHLSRWAILVFLLTYAVLIATGLVGRDESLWWKAMLVAADFVCIWITLFGTEHFIKEHVWGHVVREHVPRIFLWTLGALFVFEFLSQHIDIPMLIQRNKFLMLAAACAVGVIPQSGPHIIFVTLFADGALPFSILLANSIVQDGHGMLPLLAFSRRDFIVVKLINLIVGLAVGAAALAAGF